MKRVISIFLISVIIMGTCAGCASTLIGVLLNSAMNKEEETVDSSSASQSQQSIQQSQQNSRPEQQTASTLPVPTETDVEQFMAKYHDQFSTEYIYASPEYISSQTTYDEYIGYTLASEHNYDKQFTNYTFSSPTDKEIAELKAKKAEDEYNGYYTQVYDIVEIQNFYDNIFGKNRINVSQLNNVSDGTALFYKLSNDKLAYLRMGVGNTATFNVVYKPFEYIVKENALVVKSYVLGCCLSYVSNPEKSSAAYPNSLYYPYCGSMRQRDDIWVGYGDMLDALTYDKVISYAGISEEDIVPMDLVFYMTEDGVRLWGVGESGTVSLPPDNMIEEPSLPKVTPKSLEAEQTVTVFDGNLRMRQGPGTNYEHIQMIPDGTAISMYAKQDGWCYVKYLGRYGWVSGEFIK